MAPICVRTSDWISAVSCLEGVGDLGWSGVESVMKANGRWPLSESGMEQTQHSAMEECEEIACSMAPVRSRIRTKKFICVYSTARVSSRSG